MKNTRRKFTIARDGNCDIRIADDSVSRVHAELTLFEDGTLVLRDCGSSKGTRLMREAKQRPLQQETVQHTDRVQFGEASVAVADLLSVIQQKFPQLPKPVGGGAITPPPKKWQGSEAGSKGDRLVRCGCGTIKPIHKLCPECGQ